MTLSSQCSSDNHETTDVLLIKVLQKKHREIQEMCKISSQLMV